jgi:acyl transferase domain-containing protein
MVAEGRCSKIFAVIRGTSINQDGCSASFTAPNGEAQRDLLRQALSAAQISAADVAYIEAHGTGTALGDPIEWGAIHDVLLANSNSSLPLIIGAVKSNIGHLEGAAGIAGVIKAVMALRHRSVPPNLHLKSINPLLFQSSGRSVSFPTNCIDIQPSGSSGLLVAGVSSFGSGGTNAHVLISEYKANADPILTAESSLAICAGGKVAFIFSGQGSVYEGMGRELYDSEPIFRSTVQRCSRSVNIIPTIEEVMYGIKYKEKILDLVYSQLMIFSLEVALLSLWQSRGVTPAVVCGHSIGEYAAAVAVGIFTIENAAKLVYWRALSIYEHSAEGQGVMVAVRSEEIRALDAIKRTSCKFSENDKQRIAIAALNGTQSLVLSGDPKIVTEVLDEIGKESAVSYKYLPLHQAYHSPMMKAAAQAFKNRVATSFQRGESFFETDNIDGIRFISCLAGVSIRSETLITVDYWVQQMISKSSL